MGDRTSVTLTVLAAQADAARDILNDSANEENSYGDLTAFVFEEVNYANLGCEDDLVEAGIAFNKQWDDGGEYSAGTEYVRFRPDGTVQRMEVYDEAENPPLDALMARLDKPDDLVQFIRDYHAQVTPLPWDNQIEYGRLYAAAHQSGAEDCAQGLHSWVNETGKLAPDTRCTRCGEAYGNPD